MIRLDLAIGAEDLMSPYLMYLLNRAGGYFLIFHES